MDNARFILQKDMDRFDEYILRADNKANFILTICGALIVANMYQSKDLMTRVSQGIMKNVILIDMFVINASLIISIGLALLTIIPRTPKGTYNSVFYFEDIKSFEGDDLYQNISQMEETSLLKDLSKQVNELSRICSKKMSKIKLSYFWLGIGIVSIFFLSIINIVI
ncbi:Pycsar system effector family protein [Clostridium beijerinckii]|uniref:Pycsar system effector family protein n=1 Tax=Clostridium beijerinckii TaxID=1520 RepID=UPI00098C3216|nr:Pycsar system effector family protein [Clostridium beijerinckii]MBA8937212.1 hypothetical protein [Clostridium beijerinckii]NRU40322.1 hypothetical protein [Clostridium beijerinckii]NSA96401.1 hypothetical protein [Clostridium beijerinckii]OOM66036.1 hypothetical protein CLOBI_08760 [Clostridium beijerinckii]OOM72071.1 hypothetical protein CLBEIC_08160 [Clostridium beijerinckii]